MRDSSYRGVAVIVFDELPALLILTYYYINSFYASSVNLGIIFYLA